MNKFIVFWENYQSRTGPCFIAIKHIVQVRECNNGTIIDLSNGKSVEVDADPVKIMEFLVKEEGL